MTEWRREFKSWPKETSVAADSASLPAWVVEAGRKRSEAPGRKRWLKVASVLFVAATFAVCLLIANMPIGDPSVLIGLLAAVATIPVFVALGGSLSERAEARRRLRTLEALESVGESTLGGDGVGIAYAERNWSYPGLGFNVDEGVLRIDLDRLVFVGGATRFELPPTAILETEIRRTDIGVGDRMRLYIHWAEGGEAGTLSVALPYRRSLRHRVGEVRDLRDRVERWRAELFPHRTIPFALPPSFDPTKKDNPYVRVGPAAKVLAFGPTVAASVVFLLITEFCLRHLGWVRAAEHMSVFSGGYTLFWMWLWITLATKIEPRLPKRYRYQAKVPTDVRDALRGVAAKPEGERLNDDIEVR